MSYSIKEAWEIIAGMEADAPGTRNVVFDTIREENAELRRNLGEAWSRRQAAEMDSGEWRKLAQEILRDVTEDWILGHDKLIKKARKMRLEVPHES